MARRDDGSWGRKKFGVEGPTGGRRACRLTIGARGPVRMRELAGVVPGVRGKEGVLAPGLDPEHLVTRRVAGRVVQLERLTQPVVALDHLEHAGRLERPEQRVPDGAALLVLVGVLARLVEVGALQDVPGVRERGLSLGRRRPMFGR